MNNMTHKIVMDFISKNDHQITDIENLRLPVFRSYFATFKLEAYCYMTTKGEFSLGQGGIHNLHNIYGWATANSRQWLNDEYEKIHKRQLHLDHYRPFLVWLGKHESVYGYGGIIKLTNAFINTIYRRAVCPPANLGKLWINTQTICINVQRYSYRGG